MVHLILTGATGLVGSAVLHHMINTPAVTKVSVLSRRPVTQAEGHEKVKVIIHKDYTTYPSEILAQLKDAEGVVWAQGISSTQVNKEEYENITYTYPLAFARAISTTTSPKPVNFVYVSGEGATTTPGFLTPHWGAVKGRTESDLLALSKESAFSNLRPFSLRPGGVDPSDHKEIQSYIPEKKGLMKALEGALIPVLNAALPRMMSPTRDLARVLTDLALGDGNAFAEKDQGVSGEGRTLNNMAMRRLAGL